jgi:hypothetical protein
MLRLMLDSHPRLSCPGESDVIFSYLNTTDATWTLDAKALKRDWLFNTSVLKLIEGSPREQVAALIAQTGRGRDWTVLMVHRDLDRVLDVLPGIPVIHMLRDPRDVARSSIGMGWAGNVFHGVGHWLKTEDSWTAAAPRLRNARQMELRYESLVSQPEAEIARICAFLDVDFDPEMLTYDRRSTYSRPDRRMIEQWRRKLSAQDIGLIEGRLGTRLTERGYAPSGHPAVLPSPVDRLALAAGNKAGIWGRRIRDFGIVDSVAVAVANRIKAPQLARRAEERIQRKVLAGLK